MQMITSRQSRLLRFLLQRKGYVILSKIADFFNVSEKTIQRELCLLEQWLSGWEITVDKRAGAGIMLLADDMKNLLLLDQLLINVEDVPNVMMSNSRRVKIGLQLLRETPNETSISNLSEHYFISRASIVNDLNIIESWIVPLGLSIIRRKSGTHIEGSEINIRQAMSLLVNNIISRNAPDSIIHSRINSSGYKILVDYFGEKDVLFVKSLLRDIESEFCCSLGEPYYINIFINILIMMCRLVRGNIILEEEEGEIVFDKNSFIITKDILQRIDGYISHPVPEREVRFIYKYIIASGIMIEEHNNIIEIHNIHSSAEARVIAIRLIATFSTIVGIDLRCDEMLYDGLLIHIKPLINRLNYQIYIRNPLLKDIKGELSDIWPLTQYAVNQVFSDWGVHAVSEDEIGYFAVHFQAAMERQIICKRVLLVCSTGIGTSHLLKSRILRIFPDWIVVGVVPASSLQKINAEKNVDLIISTVHLPALELPVVYVTAFFNDEDVKRVTEKLITEKLHTATNNVVEN